MMKSPYFWIPFEILINLYSGIISVWFINRLLVKKSPEKVSKWICSILICVAFSSFLLIDRLSLDIYFSDSWVFLIIIVYGVLFYQDHWATKLLLLTILYIITSTVASFSYFLFAVIFKCSYEDLLLFSFERFLFMLFSNLMHFVTLSLIVFFFSPIKKAYFSNYGAIITLSLINLSAAFIEESLFRLYPKGIIKASFFLLICTLCLLICLLSMALYRFLYDYSEKTAKLQYQKQQKIEVYERISQIVTMFDTVNRLHHDMSKHIDIAMNLYQNGENDRAIAYLSTFKSQFPPIFSTGCLPLDSALTLRASLMKNQNITFFTELCNLSILPIEDVELCAIIMNLLDNSIEELNRSQKELNERYVRLQIRWVESMLMIRCENPCSLFPIQREKDGIVSKKRTSGIGMGIPIIKEIVDEAAGIIQIDQKDGLFIVLISLPVD